jgi:AcrR family transcriptional regulator
VIDYAEGRPKPAAAPASASVSQKRLSMQDKKQQRRRRQHDAVRDEIKTTARAHMARDGAAALSLRAVATDMGLSSAAIYYYYPNRDALITDLIVDAFRGLGAALRAPEPAADVADALHAAMSAYRTWALGSPAEFELIFGAPIPGYHAPAEVTSPEARAALRGLGELFARAHAEGRLQVVHGVAIPQPVADHLAGWSRALAQDAPAPVIVASLQAWAVGHGLVALELNGQLQPIVGDAAPLYDYSIRALLHSLGVTGGRAGTAP